MSNRQMTRRAFVALGATALAANLLGCGTAGTKEADKSQNEEAMSTTGGWEANADVPMSGLSADERSVFDKALESYVGMDFLPVCTLATQVVAGTNYAFLCSGTPAVPDAESGWFVVTVFEDLQGSCQISSVEEIDVSEPATSAEGIPENLLGGWSLSHQVFDTATIIIPEEAATAFAAGGEGYAGMSLKPLALLATQVVAGTNYRLLCMGQPAAPDAQSQLYVVDVYEPLSGTAEYTSVDAFDLLAYV